MAEKTAKVAGNKGNGILIYTNDEVYDLLKVLSIGIGSSPSAMARVAVEVMIPAFISMRKGLLDYSNHASEYLEKRIASSADAAAMGETLINACGIAKGMVKVMEAKKPSTYIEGEALTAAVEESIAIQEAKGLEAEHIAEKKGEPTSFDGPLFDEDGYLVGTPEEEKKNTISINEPIVGKLVVGEPVVKKPVVKKPAPAPAPVVDDTDLDALLGIG